MPEGVSLPEAMRATLLCFVLVGPASSHAFCSRYDFGPWPLLEGVTSLRPDVSAVRACSHTSHTLPLAICAVVRLNHGWSDPGASRNPAYLGTTCMQPALYTFGRRKERAASL